MTRKFNNITSSQALNLQVTTIVVFSSHLLMFLNRLRNEKTCLRGFPQSEFQPVSSATETSLKIEILPVASLHMILSKKRITKVLIRLRGCAGWSAPLLLANPRRQVFLCHGPDSLYYKQYGPRSDCFHGINLTRDQSDQGSYCLFP